MNKQTTYKEWICFILIIIGLIGYVLNFQNLFQYAFSTNEFIVSAIGVFFPPLGTFCGFAL